MRNYYFGSLVLALLYACGGDPQPKHSFYFGGEIVNPTSEYVVLFKGETPVDSAKLDASGRFELRLDTIQNGLYHFFHRPEYQYLYLEPGDSLQIRLNTVAFDESLVYSGQGEAVNNFLMDLFLEAEGEDPIIRDGYTRLEPGVFRHRLDSLLERKLGKLEVLSGEEPLSEGAREVAYSTILYRNYFYRESYPFWHRKFSEDRTLHPLPGDFYDYRKKISYNDPDLAFLRPYYDFMKFHIANIAYMGCQEACDETKLTFSKTLHFNRHQLSIIDSLVSQEELRDNLFRTVAFDYLLKNDTEAHFEIFMEDFQLRSANNRHLQEIHDLREGIRNLRANKPLPLLYVRNQEGDSLLLGDLSTGAGSTVFYFWSGPEPRHLRNISQKVRELEVSYPQHRFIGICLRTEWDRWNELVDTYGLNPQQQFWARDFEEFAHTLVVYHPFKSIIVRDNRIIDGFANLNTSF